jgi:hypothetical protein
MPRHLDHGYAVTSHTAEDLVEIEPVGKLHLKGFLKPVPAFNALRLQSTTACHGRPCDVRPEPP